MEKSSDEGLIRRYLLGDVTQKEKEEVEDRLFLDSDFLDHLLVIENELTNDYLLNCLTPDQHTRFEEFFLRAPERRRTLKVSEQLKEYASRVRGETAIVPHRIRRKAVWKWMFLNPRIAVSVVLIILSALLLWLLKDRQILKSRVAELRSQQDSQQETASSTRQQLANEQAENHELRKHIKDEQQKVISLEAQVELLEKSLTKQRLETARRRGSQPYDSNQLIGRNKPEELWPDQTRGAGKSNVVQVEPKAKEVLLQLKLEGDEYTSYIVEARNADNEKIWSKANIVAQQTLGGKALIVKMPARILPTGDYIMVVRGARAGESPARIDSYQFKVDRK